MEHRSFKPPRQGPRLCPGGFLRWEKTTTDGCLGALPVGIDPPPSGKADTAGPLTTIRDVADPVVPLIGGRPSTQPGFLVRQSYHDRSNNRWTEIVEWNNLADAHAAMERIQRDPSQASAQSRQPCWPL